jgi:rubrerythrin
MISPIQRLVWSDAGRRARILLRFAEIEADGGRDLVRAAEATADPVLRGLFLRHAADEARHAALFRSRGAALLADHRAANAEPAPEWFAEGERGLDDLQVERESTRDLLAFVHLSEKAAARAFRGYEKVLEADPGTRELFQQVGRDETFHMTYTLKQLKRLDPKRHRWTIWKARLRRLWRAYLRLAGAIGAVFGAIVLSLEYFVVLPPFALLDRRAQRRETPGWRPVDEARARALSRQY